MLKDFQAFDIGALAWTDLTSNVKGLPSARSGHGLLSFGGKLYAWGGWDGAGKKAFSLLGKGLVALGQLSICKLQSLAVLGSRLSDRCARELVAGT